jgi:hypothetical protein
MLVLLSKCQKLIGKLCINTYHQRVKKIEVVNVESFLSADIGFADTAGINLLLAILVLDPLE